MKLILVMSIFAIIAALSGCVAMSDISSAGGGGVSSVGSSSSSAASVTTNFVLANITTNSQGTNGMAVTYLTTNDSPPTWFSNYVATNAASFPFLVTIITNAQTNGITVFCLTNFAYFTNYSGASTNFISSVTVTYTLYLNSTNESQADIVSNYVIINDSNFLVSNYITNYVVTNITNALTNGVFVYQISNTGGFTASNAFTNYYPIWRYVGYAGISAGQAGSAGGTSLAFVNGVPFVAYADSGYGMKGVVQYFSNNTWYYLGNAGFTSSLAWGMTGLTFSSGIPYIAYDYSTVTVMYYSNNIWTNLTNYGSSGGTGLSFTVEGGIPYAAYQDNSGGPYQSKGIVKYFSNGQTNTLGSAFSTSNMVSPCLAINNGILYASYKNYGYAGADNKISVAYYSNDSWNILGNPSFSLGAATYPKLAFNNNGVPYVVYNDNISNFQAVVKYYSNSTWNTLGIEGFSNGEADYTVIAFNNGIPYVAYEDNGFMIYGKMTVMYYSNNTWNVLGTRGFTAGSVQIISLAFNEGVPYVAFEDNGNGSKATVMYYK